MSEEVSRKKTNSLIVSEREKYEHQLKYDGHDIDVIKTRNINLF